MDSLFKVKINEKQTFEIDANNLANNWDLADLGDGRFHLLVENQSYNIQIVEFNEEEKQVKLMVNGKAFTADIKTNMDLLLEKMGMGNLMAKKAQDLKAPMPGLVLDIKAESGNEVKKGDGLLVLEAMKMENVLKAAHDAVIKTIKVNKGQAVEKGEILIEFE